ncbi:MAG: terminase small subunit [Terrimicrobiaceae bacterium]|jgi:hypothetical protein|nr:terminase small subunit [Terrimicrobiaceae bacterium]
MTVRNSTRLTPAQIEFVNRHILDGEALGVAFLGAFPQLTANWNPKDSGNRMSMACQAGSRLIEKAHIKKYITQLIAKAKRKAERPRFLSLEEKREFLAEVVRTPVGEVDEFSPLTQEVTYSADGSQKIKLPCKHRALELDARLMGEFQDSVRLDIGEKIIKLATEVA